MVAAIANGARPRALIDEGSFNGGYPFDLDPEDMILTQTLLGTEMWIAPNFLGFVQRAYRESPIVFAVIANRIQLFRQARFQWRDRQNGRPGDLFGTPELAILEKPWPGATTGTMLALAEAQNACAGNFFAYRDGDRLRVMRPDWTDIVLGSLDDETVGPLDLNAELVAYVYQPRGFGAKEQPIVLAPEQVVHYMPTPDPEIPWRGMSWLSPIIAEISADKEMTKHKRAYLRGGATPNLGMVLDPQKLNIKTPDDFEAWVKKFEELRSLRSGGNPYKIMFTVGGADPKVLGANLDQIDFSQVQGSGEVRVAAAGMVHPTIAGIEAGLKGSALNAGNFEAAFRQFANGTIRPLWDTMAGALERVVPKPRDSVELAPDDRDIPALEEDAKKLSDTFKTDAETASTLYMGGWEADSVIDAIVAKDMRLLKGRHSGLPSVQVQKQGAPGTNGAGDKAAVPTP
jgi:hypothetical protein